VALCETFVSLCVTKNKELTQRSTEKHREAQRSTEKFCPLVISGFGS